MISFFAKCDGLLAQLVEQRTLNPSVECSSHSQPTRDIKDLGENLGPFLLPVCDAICETITYTVVFGAWQIVAMESGMEPVEVEAVAAVRRRVVRS